MTRATRHRRKLLHWLTTVSLMLALALQRAGRKEEAAQRLTAVTRRFGRSVDSAQLRRAALRALQPQAQAPKK